MGIWGAIVLELKGPVHFLEKEDHMNSDIYINQVLKELGLPFYNQCIEKKVSIIWMNNGTCYHTSKTTAVYCRCIGLICINWPAQSPEPQSHQKPMADHQNTS